MMALDTETVSGVRDCLLRRLERVKQHRGYWNALCPSHEDHEPSLAVREHDDGVSVKCHAGCTTEEILGAIGWKKSDLYPKKEEAELRVSKSSETVEYYYYQDEEGNPLFRVKRTPTKDFYQQRYEGGQYLNRLGDVEPVLYRLPELASRPDDPVFVVEGEKDADRLLSLGLLATTNPMGAGKWREGYAKWLDGRTVYVIPDNDKAGEDHAQDITASIPRAKIVRLPGLPRKGDVSDWLDAGGVSTQLLRIAEEPQEQKNGHKKGRLSLVSAKDLISKEFPPVKWIIPNLIPAGTMLLAGKPKMGKSWLALQMCLAVAGGAGGQALGEIAVVEGDAFYLALEDNERRLQDRLNVLLAGSEAPERLYMTTVAGKLDTGLLADLEELLEAHPEARIVVIDTVAKIRGTSTDRRTLYEQDYEVGSELTELAGRHNVAIILVHHLRKGDAEDPLDLISGSTGLSGGVDGALVLTRTRSAADAVLKAVHRDLKDDPELALAWEPDGSIWRLIGDAEEYRISKERREILDVLANADEPMRPKEIAEAIDKLTPNVTKLLQLMREDGQVDNASYGKYIVAANMVPPPTLNTPHPLHNVHSVHTSTTTSSMNTMNDMNEEEGEEF